MIALDHEERGRMGLQYVLDLMAPRTPYGAERVRRPRFFTPTERGALEREWRNVGRAAASLAERPDLHARLDHLLGQVRDIRATLRRCREEVLSEVELFEVKRFLLQLSLIEPVLREMDAGFEGIRLTREPEALALLDPEGHGAAGFAVMGPPGGPLARAREEKARVERDLRRAGEGPEREALLDRRRLLVAREEEEDLRERGRLSHALRPYLEALLRNAQSLGALDFTLRRGELARARGGVMPRVTEGALRMTGMTNPQTADGLAGKGRAFIPVTIEAPLGATVITGANMGGKSVALRTLALNIVLCHAGFFAFAREAELPLFDSARLLGEDPADAEAGLSSFGAEVTRIERALREINSGAFCFLALDEPARGTNPREGAALAQALVARLAGCRAVAVVATHYEGVAARASAHYRSAGLADLPAALTDSGLPGQDGPDSDPVAAIARRMNYGLLKVDARAPAPREALAICRLLGLDGMVLAEMERLIGEEA